LESIRSFFKQEYGDQSYRAYDDLEFISMRDLTAIEKRVLVEKRLISPHLAKYSQVSGVLISANEQLSMMINEEDHVRIQLYFPGFQLTKALTERSEEHTSELQSRFDLVCRLLLEKKKMATSGHSPSSCA